jgi:hypothetical protein
MLSQRLSLKSAVAEPGQRHAVLNEPRVRIGAVDLRWMLCARPATRRIE